MNKSNLKSYAQLKSEAKRIDFALKELAPLILKEMAEADLDKVPTSLGNFSVKKMKKWTYSEKVEEIKLALDERKADEEATGTATFTEMPILEFRENKENEK